MGHLFRAVNLARHFRTLGVDCMILLDEHAPSARLLREECVAFEIVPLNDLQRDWESEAIKRFGITTWINDRLDTAIEHASKVVRRGVRLITFDDHGSGAKLADLHFAALAFSEAEQLRGKKVLRGIAYIVLSPDIDRLKKPRVRSDRILVTLGGTDTYGVTIKVIELLAQLGRQATVVLGPGFQHHTEIQNVVQPDFIVKQDILSLVEELSHYDLAITGGGITPFEANASGLPCLTVSSERFEVEPCRFLAELGTSLYLGHRNEIDVTTLGNALREADVAAMSAMGLAKIDTGGVKRIMAEIAKL